jgi:hypothetical protein
MGVHQVADDLEHSRAVGTPVDEVTDLNHRHIVGEEEWAEDPAPDGPGQREVVPDGPDGQESPL